MTALDQALARLPLAHPGPGGAVAVLKEGQVLARNTWGYADIAARLPFTPATLFRICSITKQFTCALARQLFPDLEPLNAPIRAAQPLLGANTPSALHMAHNQSGLRDYWATAMLSGAPVEGHFADAEAAALIARTESLHFTPGTQYSYCNQNFRLIGEAVEQLTGRGFAELLRAHVFDPAGLPTARLCADTSAMPDGTIGYEGSLEVGFRPAVNNIVWTGDAGIGASLDDMIAWERFIDATRDLPDSLYHRLTVPVSFADGNPAGYGFGLGRPVLFGHPASSHGGALRGWRSFRCYLPGPRISVVVLFNHMGAAHVAAMDLLRAALGQDDSTPTPQALPETRLPGTYLDTENGLIARIETAGPGQLRLHYAQNPELLDRQADDSAGTGGTTLRRGGDGITMHRAADNRTTRLIPATGPADTDLAGRYHNAELDAVFTCTTEGGIAYGAFSGPLGQGEMQILQPDAAGLWRLPMPRALDHTPPGDWTLRVLRDGTGRISAIEIGCWLARQVMFTRI